MPASTSIFPGRLGYGAMGISAFYDPKPSDEEGIALLEKVMARKVFIDTAEMYGPDHNEILIGKALKKFKREDIFVCTKTGFDTKTFAVNNDPNFIKEACEKSLRKLQTDYIDLYYIHRIDPKADITETAKVLKDLQKEGKIKYIGLSECSANTLKAAEKVVHIDAVQWEYSPWTIDIETNGVLDVVKSTGAALVAYSPLGRGFLTGKYKSTDDLPNDWRKGNPRFVGEAFQNNLKLVEKIQKLAAKHSCAASQLVLAWVIAQHECFFPIPGTTNASRFDENMGALNVKLNAEDLKEIRAAMDSVTVAGTRYEEAHMKMTNI